MVKERAFDGRCSCVHDPIARRRQTRVGGFLAEHSPAVFDGTWVELDGIHFFPRLVSIYEREDWTFNWRVEV